MTSRSRAVSRSRTCLLLALALLVFTSGVALGERCAPVAIDVSCPTEPAEDVSGNPAFAAQEPEAAVEPTARTLDAALDSGSAPPRLDGERARDETPRRRAAAVSSPPLFLSHCALLR